MSTMGSWCLARMTVLGEVKQKKAACAALWFGFVYLNLGKLNCGGTPMRVLIIHCCAIDKMLFVIQYSTRPDGKKKNITENTSGMIHISLACIGSGGAGLSAVCSMVVRVITRGKIK